MISTAIILFREVLEAALLIGLIAAGTKAIPGRTRWIVSGIAAGLAGAALVAAFTDSIASLASGVGQELFNASVLGIAVAMLAWHNIWMASHGMAMAREAKNLGTAVREGSSELSAIMLVVGLAVLREGSESVLFLHGIGAAEGGQQSALYLGALLGISAGAAAGYGLYAGLLHIPVRWFFNATAGLVLLMAAGFAAQAAAFLIQADVLQHFTTPLWDSSAFIPAQSALGVALHSLAGYEPQPSGMQLLFFAATALLILLGMKLAKPGHLKSSH